jgi:hypothetical protein
MMTALFALLALAADPAFTSIARGPISAVTDAQQVVVRSQPEWEVLWASHSAAQPVPAVDFSTEMVAAIFLGTRATGGFSVQVTGTRHEGDALVIEYADRRPGRRDVVTQILTAPFHMVRLPRHDGAVRFEAAPPAP